MTVLTGSIECKVNLYFNNNRIGTALFLLDVEKAGLNEGTDISETDIPDIIALAREQEENAAASAEAAAASASAAATSETNAAESESNAAESERNASTSETNAASSASAAASSATNAAASESNAATSATNAATSATNANADALKAEGHAIGKQNGIDVTSESPYYHNSAKYWADQARQSAAGGVGEAVIAPVESSTTASQSYAIGDQFFYNDVLYTATAAISQGDTITPETNCTPSDDITTQIKDHTTPPMSGATSTTDGTGGSIPAPLAGQQNNYFAGDGSWHDIEADIEEDVRGVNLIQNTASTTTVNGVTFTVNSDGSVTLNGTATADTTLLINNKVESVLSKGETYTLSKDNGTSAIHVYIDCYKSGVYVRNLAQGYSGATNTFEATFSDFDTARASIWVANGQTVSNLTLYPMLRKADISDDTYRSYNEQSIQNQLNDRARVLGAKNLMPHPYYQSFPVTVNGVTFTENSDGSITVNGTATSTTTVYLANTDILLEKGNYLISSGNNNTGKESEQGFWIGWYTYSTVDSSYSEYRDYDISNGKGQFTIDNTHYCGRCRIVVISGKTVNNQTIYPMLRLASDPDDTYVPYAMTNRELTEKVGSTAIPSALGTTITGALANIPFRFGIDSSGNYGYIKAGADTVTPFKNGLLTKEVINTRYSYGNYVVTVTLQNDYAVVLVFMNASNDNKTNALCSLTISGTYDSQSDIYNTGSFSGSPMVWGVRTRIVEIINPKKDTKLAIDLWWAGCSHCIIGYK